jgi:hypothetical protein
MSKKQIITVDVEDISPYDFESTLGNVKARIEDFIAKYGIDARLSWDPNFWYQYDSSPSPRFNVSINREETDAEYDKRILNEKTNASMQEERERKEFERLQSKFGAK